VAFEQTDNVSGRGWEVKASCNGREVTAQSRDVSGEVLTAGGAQHEREFWDSEIETGVPRPRVSAESTA
jgi:hypothetical protein